MKKFSEELKKIGYQYLTQAMQQNFMQAVIKGEISDEQELYYIQQDKIYLTGYQENGKNVPGYFSDVTNAARQFFKLFPNPKFKILTNEADIEEDEVRDEFELHYQNFEGINNHKYQQLGKITKKYLDFLSHSRMESLLISLVSVQPCAWGYAELALKLKQMQSHYKQPWDKWIDFYTDTDFVNEGKLLFSEIDLIAAGATEAELEQARLIFIQGMQLENEFWQQCFEVQVNNHE